MRTVSSFPRRVHDIENVFIPVSGGGRLAARIWLPEDAEPSPVPAILEYIPYRKGDRMRDRDEAMHRYFPASVSLFALIIIMNRIFPYSSYDAADDIAPRCSSRRSKLSDTPSFIPVW